jgi:hypothetical protein
MLKKLQTPLHHFRFNRTTGHKSLIVEWFLYDLNEDIEENIRGFNDAELKLFEGYTVSNSVNFGGGKDYFTVREGEVPIEVELDFVPDSRLAFPEYLIIKPDYEIEKGTEVSSIMQIVLLDGNGAINHKYVLPFGVIGRILH